MSHFISRRRAMVGTAAAWAPVAWPAWSQSFPARTITLIVPSLAGGGTDAIARALGQELSKKLGQNVVIDNAAGASGGIGAAKARPGRISVGVSGLAALPALAVSMLEDAAQIDLLKVPYKGAAQVMSDLLGGQVDLGVTALLNSLGPARAGHVKMIGLMSQERAPEAPEFPLLAETVATREVSLDIWSGLFGPAGVPAPVVAQINSAVQSVLKDPVYRAARAKAGEQTARPASAEEFNRFVVAETARYRAAARRLPMEQ